MKRTVLAFAALTLSASALADISDNNPDLRGWAVEDQRLLSVERRNSAEVKSPFGNNPDQYAGVLSDETPVYRDGPATPGVGDSYGSVLHQVGFDF